MKYLYNILVVILFITAVSCEFETSVDASDLLETPELVVINGYLSPQDETIKVQVSKSKSRADASSQNLDDLVVKDAIVTIIDEEQNEVKLSYNNETFNYEIAATEFNIESGLEYFLKVTVDQKAYQASCVIPSVIVTNIQETFGKKNDEFGSSTPFVNVQFDDLVNIDNFYIVGAIIKDQDFDSTVNFDLERFVTDTNRDGASITVDGFFYRTIDGTNTMVIQVANVDRLLYETLRATFLNEYNEGDPFAEPIIAPTNIEGDHGYGVFAGYQLTEKEVVF